MGQELLDNNDIDPTETTEWLAALDSVVRRQGNNRAKFLLNILQKQAELLGCPVNMQLNTPYRNTLPASLKELISKEELTLIRNLENLVRWNAVAIVVRTSRLDGSLGGHIGTFASACTLYEVGFNYFWHSEQSERGADLIYIQGHSSPGIYARAFLEGRLTKEQLINFRRESAGKGLSSYPHPWLMKGFWQFPTVSMGLGPIQAIYQARLMRYLAARNLAATKKRHVWCFCGDGEMDEPESLGALTVAGREKLDNLIFVVNCNLQRLDGPVRGNGKIIQELESVFKGAGWNVIKVIWGSEWDDLLAKDKDNILQNRMTEVIDGEYQDFKAHGGSYEREHFFGTNPQLLEMVRHLSDEEITNLRRGGHDYEKVYSAYDTAVQHTGQPTVILAKTIKGYGLGLAGESQNTAHNTKKLTPEQLVEFKNKFNIPISDDDAMQAVFYSPDEDSPEIKFLKQQRENLGGYLPVRRVEADETLLIPNLDSFAAQLKDSGEREISTTMAFVRMLTTLSKDKNIGSRVVPIVPDESRTLGMEGLFRQIGIYAPEGQLYKPVDAKQVMYYREAKDGQILQEGLNEGGAFSSWLAAATSYSNHNVTLIPFYIYYSMFGFQRIGDLAFAAGDARARGFLIGGTSGRTTLNGEGLQHEDGHSHILANTIPNCIAYDPSFSYELAVIIQDGLRRMYSEKESVFYYITTMNENYQQPALPEQKNIVEQIIKGMYCLQKTKKEKQLHVQLLGCGSILNEVRAAAQLLKDFNVTADVWSATSLNELAREGQKIERWNRMNCQSKPKIPYVTTCLKDTNGPVIAATDYMKVFADQIRAFIPKTFITLGTDGFGRSDTRSNLRSFFEVDRYNIVIAALYGLAKDGKLEMKVVEKAIKKYGIDSAKPDPIEV